LFYIPDSLKTKTFKELNASFEYNINNSKATIYADAYTAKAKNEQNTIKLVNAYVNYIHISESNIGIRYCDSIIALTNNITHYQYPAQGYLTKGILHYAIGNYKESLDNLLKAKKIAYLNNNFTQIFNANYYIASIKIMWGDNDEALELYKLNLKMLQKNKNLNIDYLQFELELLLSLSNAYLLSNKLDSAGIAASKGLQNSLALKDSTYYYNFVSQSGIVAYYQKNHEISIDSLQKSIAFENSFNGLLNNHYYQGLAHTKLSNITKAFYHFNKADSIYMLSKDVVPEVRTIQEYLINYYKGENDSKNQLKHINRLLYVDSVLNINYINLNKTLKKEYDTPELLAQKEKIISNLKTKKDQFFYIIILLISFVLIAIFFGIKTYLKQQKIKKQFKKLLNKSKEKETSKNTPKKTGLKLKGISKVKIKQVLKLLNEFEKNQGFLNNKITLNSLSKEFDTNSSYLSKIINFHKEKNFSTYISDLRINYCVEKLKTENNFRKYTVSAIAFEIGFNNVESFSKAFYKITGMNPSHFIKHIEKNSK
ncbi:MAG: helix-turn-helix domain-containing protein, partial [Lutibacter sp.]|uniref:helix-turn-helix domain-containing protein n=1 Tax=Lutibacter sp. TaxID=1925666 RepID=UPI0017E4D273